MPDVDLMRLLRYARHDTPYVNLLKSLTIDAGSGHRMHQRNWGLRCEI